MYHRREILLSIGRALAATTLGRPLGAQAASSPKRNQLGICTDSYAIRRRAHRETREAGERFDEPLRFLEYCHNLGAGGVQLEIGRRDQAYAARLRRQAQDWGMFVEASIILPRDQFDIEQFEAAVVTARNAGVIVIRVVLPSKGSGRRYESYKSVGEFRQARARGRRMLELVEPVVARHRVRLAVENHKDERVAERLETLKSISSEYVGACVDTGNDIAFLEDPMEVIEAYAPWAFSVHLKDMAVQEYEDGFLLAEVPLGEGLLDMPKVVQTLRHHHPELRFSLEMITRDPLKVPCLMEQYWTAMGDIPGRDLARALRMVRSRGRKQALPQVSHLPLTQQFALEQENVRKSLDYARKYLAL